MTIDLLTQHSAVLAGTIRSTSLAKNKKKIFAHTFFLFRCTVDDREALVLVRHLDAVERAVSSRTLERVTV